jgi:hypothetical protein
MAQGQYVVLPSQVTENSAAEHELMPVQLILGWRAPGQVTCSERRPSPARLEVPRAARLRFAGKPPHPCNFIYIFKFFFMPYHEDRST